MLRSSSRKFSGPTTNHPRHTWSDRLKYCAVKRGLGYNGTPEFTFTAIEVGTQDGGARRNSRGGPTFIGDSVWASRARLDPLGGMRLAGISASSASRSKIPVSSAGSVSVPGRESLRRSVSTAHLHGKSDTKRTGAGLCQVAWLVLAQL